MRHRSPANVMASYGRQWLDENDYSAVANALSADMLTGGKFVEQFEDAFCKKVGASHAVACSNGTAALHLSCLAVGLGPGKTAVVPAVTFVATANAVRMTGASVMIADVDPENGLLTDETLSRAILEVKASGGLVSAVLPVHLSGQVAQVNVPDGITRIDDGCHALGSVTTLSNGIRCQVGGDDLATMTTFSFHPVKTITTGEGGMITTSDPELANRLRSLRNHGIQRDPSAFTVPEAISTDNVPEPWFMEASELGWNYRLTDIQCALGLSQLGKLDWFLARRRALVAEYDAALADLYPLIKRTSRLEAPSLGWHLYVALIDFEQIGWQRGVLMRELRQRGIGTQVHYIPLPIMPYYRDSSASDWSGAKSYYDKCLSLPLHPGMQDGDAERVVGEIRSIINV